MSALQVRIRPKGDKVQYGDLYTRFSYYENVAQLHDAPTRERPLVVGRLVRDTPDGLEPAAEICAFTFDVGAMSFRAGTVLV